MGITRISSVKVIEQQYRTGEEPVLVMCSDLNAYVCKYMRSSAASYNSIERIVLGLKKEYSSLIFRSSRQTKLIIEEMPKEWNVPAALVKDKLQQLFDKKWIAGVWDNFIECLNENLEYELLKV